MLMIMFINDFIFGFCLGILFGYVFFKRLLNSQRYQNGVGFYRYLRDGLFWKRKKGRK